MKTYQQFLEVTAADIRAMGGNEKQMKILRDRQKARGGTGMGQKGSTGSHMHQKQDKKGGALATRKPSNITKSPSSALALRPADKGAAIVRTKKGNQTDSTGFKADPKKQRGYMSSPDTKTNPRSRPVNRQAQARRLVRKGLEGTAGLAGKAIGKMRDGGTPGRVKSATAPSMGGGAFTSKFSR